MSNQNEHLHVKSLQYCSVCGALETFRFSTGDARDDGACRACGAVLKVRDAAHLLLNHTSHGRVLSLKELQQKQPKDVPRIVEFAYSSAMAKQMLGHPCYEQVYFWLSGRTQTTSTGHKIPFCDLHATGFEDASRDVIITNDALGFVTELGQVLQEMARVIRRGGAFIAINKVDWPVPSQTVEFDGQMQKLYRVPDGTMPLRRKIGSDLRDLFAKNGFRLMLREIGFSTAKTRNFSLVGVRL